MTTNNYQDTLIYRILLKKQQVAPRIFISVFVNYDSLFLWAVLGASLHRPRLL